MDLQNIEKSLISEVNLNPIQARVFLLVTTKGKLTAKAISEKLEIPYRQALQTAKELMELGGFIDITESEFEAMHPRFTAVNMYRKRCEREKISFKKNLVVDNIGVVLETYYDAARTK